MSVPKVHASEICESCGNPTVEGDLCTSEDVFRAAVPTGASAGIYYIGKGISKTAEHIDKIIKTALISKKLSVTEQDKLRIKMDGTEKKFGADDKLVCKAGATEKGALYQVITDLGNSEVTLPILGFTVMGDGSHDGNKLACAPPTHCSKLWEAHVHLRMLQGEMRGRCHLHGDKGRFASNILKSKEAPELLKSVIRKAGTASAFFMSGEYNQEYQFPDDHGGHVTPAQLADLYKSFIKNHPVVSIEDPFDQDDWGLWKEFMAYAGIQVVGYNVTGTNPKQIARLCTRNCVTLLIVNQIRSVTESEHCMLALHSGWNIMVSHHSVEPEGTSPPAGWRIKIGVPGPSTCVAMSHQLLRIEEEPGKKTICMQEELQKPPVH
uniref:phosphopyruvate hydratase n=1 Tax=Otolemur garnettii TaxID=30611 RepID=H0XUR2_OTOGA